MGQAGTQAGRRQGECEGTRSTHGGRQQQREQLSPLPPSSPPPCLPERSPTTHTRPHRHATHV